MVDYTVVDSCLDLSQPPPSHTFGNQTWHLTNLSNKNNPSNQHILNDIHIDRRAYSKIMPSLNENEQALLNLLHAPIEPRKEAGVLQYTKELIFDFFFVCIRTCKKKYVYHSKEY